jgi:hypothetical protein
MSVELAVPNSHITAPLCIKPIYWCKELFHWSVFQSRSSVFAISLDSSKTLRVQLVKLVPVSIFDDDDKILTSPAVSALHTQSPEQK